MKQLVIGQGLRQCFPVTAVSFKKAIDKAVKTPTHVFFYILYDEMGSMPVAHLHSKV